MMQEVSFGYRRGATIVSRFSLTMTGPARIAIEGPNGSGKTTILKLAAGVLAQYEGTIERPARFALLDQEVALLDAATSIVENFRRMNTDTGVNEARAALARFEYRAIDADRIVSTLSGGQKMRAAIACTLGGASPPELIVLDEPTNHLDLETVEALEAGLAAYDGGLLVVSHDEQFLERIGIDRRIKPAG
jgi:ATPase subunit of ABC transporter with duplicated ATPase domains